MKRLTLEQLARLVDEAPTDEEREVLSKDPSLRAELEALKAQTAALKGMPSVLPPPDGWDDLEARLEAEGLVRRTKPRMTIPPRWLQAAAGLALFLGGGLAATALQSSPEGSDQVATANYANVEEAVQAVEFAERQYLAAVDGYQRVRQVQGQQEAPRNPASRYAALEALLAASQAAVRESPADPFFNGVLINTLREREQVMSQISRDNWY
ncbi:MAG: hypothetical protein ACR2QM_06950 [Longimicrobiales bacterium]